ncbi:S8 family serine peptidase [Pseudalkalibacillus salsuginis]|uniref:S8 family serine peptidase n=1 Tax=Pseudalkalibacillus salsuginis TaxID=2910972 RepID=UPI001F23990D|nr:S8 family serine peptidase [Pseudalkalibacillus salsuginis]MCF6411155.1 S8 family serine peptidase [Pseudalkalibacillus salsuginis]
MKKKHVVASAVLATSMLLTSIGGASGAEPGKKLQQAKNPDFAPAMVNKDDNKLFDNLESMLSEKQASDKIGVIVRFDDSMANQKAHEAIMNKVGKFNTKFTFDKAINGVAATMTKKQIQQLENLPFVKSVEYDAPVKAFNGTANTWFGTEKARADYGFTGDGDGNTASYSKDDQVVAVIDTGIDASHVDLDEGKVIGWKDFVNNRTTPYDDQGHGTHVASTVAGDGDGNPTHKGVAPGAALVGVKVLDSLGSGSMSNVTAGIEWAVENKDVYGIEVLSLSLGTSASSDGTDSTSQAVNQAVDAGLVVTVAAGNSGPSKKTVGSPGAAEKAITVGAGADVGEGGFFLADFSSRGETADGRIKPDIIAPGYNLTAAEANSGNGYVTYSGTSMATPFTAGTIALMLEANSALTPSQVRNVLADTAEDWGPAGKDVDYGHGRLDGFAAISDAGNLSGTNIATPNHFAEQNSLGGSGAADTYQFTVDNTNYPSAVTLIIPDWQPGFLWWGSTPDFDVYLYNPSGQQVAKSEGTERQETITFKPTTTGTYTLKVSSYSGNGSYYLDLSAGTNGLNLTSNQ